MRASEEVQCATATADKPDDAWLRPRIDLLNLSSAGVPLSELTVRYWYTPDSPSTPTSACDFATIDCANIVVTFEAVAPPRAGAGEVAVMTFLPAAGSVAASGHTNEIGLRVGKADFTNLDETDDYSYSGGGAALVDDAHITLYRNGRLIWGSRHLSPRCPRTSTPTHPPRFAKNVTPRINRASPRP